MRDSSPPFEEIGLPPPSSLASKRALSNDGTADSSKRAHTSDVTKQPNPYFALPPPTDSYVTLYFTLCRFKRTFRIVRVPRNYTFANLHMFIMFLFESSNHYLHKMEVFDNIELYKAKKGEIKEGGRINRWLRQQIADGVTDPHSCKGTEPLMHVNMRPAGQSSFGGFDDGPEGIIQKTDAEVTVGEI